jgi:DUF1365 family protein
MVYLDLDELPSLVGKRGLIGSDRWGARAFLRGDHLFDASRPLGEEVREIIRQQTGTRACGPIRLLTQLRYFGIYFSPLNLFYVYDQRGRRLEYIVAEVSNTPWMERHCYVLWNGNRSGAADSLRFSHAKEFHVSPFMDMNVDYHWGLNEPDSSLMVQVANVQGSRRLFDAGMTLRRHPMSRRQLRRMTVRYPLMTAQISTAIYYQALKLWWKKCPFYTHPNKQDKSQRLTPRPSKRLPTTTRAGR